MSLVDPIAEGSVIARQLRLAESAKSIDDVRFTIASQPLRRQGRDQVIVEVRAAAVNPSDAKAAIGLMPYATWPRTPGRDFAGVVIEGPSDIIDAEVWGSGGELGIRRDGTHASHIVLDAAAVRRKPKSLSMTEAAGIGVPFITALDGFRRTGMPRAGEVVLIFGVNGKVGQAAAQLASAEGARVIGVVRRAEPYVGHASSPVEVVDISAGDAAERIRALTGGKGADIAFNTIGSPYFELGQKTLALAGRQIFITTIEKIVPLDLFGFFRSRHTYFGVDTLALNSTVCAAMLDDLRSGFESGTLKPFDSSTGTYGFADAGKAYAAVLRAERPRFVLTPDA